MSNTEKKISKPLSILVLIIRWWKVLLIVAVAAALISTGASMLIHPRYKSTAIIMPTSSNAVSQMIMNTNSNEDLDATQFGSDIMVDQMLQILNSRGMQDHLIEKFNLSVHYAIDTNGKSWKSKLYNAVQGSCRYSRTSYLGVQISVIDEDPQFAADMANEIVDYYDTLKRGIIKQRSEGAFSIVQGEMDEIEKTIAELVDSLSGIMSHGVYHYEGQSERLMEQYAKDLASGNTAAVNRLKGELSVLEEWAPSYLSVRSRILFLKYAQVFLQQKYQAIRADANYSLPQKFVVEYAVASDKKDYPKRMMIVLMSTIGALALALLLVIAQEGIKNAYAIIRKELESEEK